MCNPKISDIEIPFLSVKNYRVYHSEIEAVEASEVAEADEVNDDL